MVVYNDYEVSSEGAVRHWEIPYARITKNPVGAPIESNPVEVISAIVAILGHKLTGTCLSIDAGRSVAVIDFTAGMVYRHWVRNVLTYDGGGAANTWGLINIGDPVYFDHGAAAIAADIQLSTSPAVIGGDLNSFFGYVVATDEVDAALFAKAAAGAPLPVRCGVLQCGAGAW